MTNRLPLQDEVVAISGRLVSLSHADAADLISSAGGRFTRTVTRKTTMLVVGGDGLPLSADGTPDGKLQSVHVGVSAHVIRKWIRHGLLAPVTVNNGLQLFDFGQVSRLGTLAELATNGVSPSAIRAGLKQLSQWLDDPHPMELLTAVDSHRHNLIVRLKDGRLAETRGQLLFDFDAGDSDDEGSSILGLPTTPLLEQQIRSGHRGDRFVQRCPRP
jgi:DNA-binding transcriptional MerR regulator